MKQRYYYGIEYAYGRDIANGWPRYDKGGGTRADKVRRFTYKPARDVWVEYGGRNGNGERDALKASDIAVRRVLSEPYYDW